MKKLFKLAVSLFSCATIFLTGCAKTSELTLPSELVGPDAEIAYPAQFDMISPSFFMYTDAENSADEKEAWLEAMYEKYQVRLNILCDSAPAKDKLFGGAATVQRNNLLSDRKEEFTGIVEFSNYAQLQTAVTNGTVLHLEGYLVNNPTWNALPESAKGKFWAGHNYALPASTSQTLKVRTFTNDSLAKTQTPVTDLESLKNYAINYKFLTGDYALSSDGLANLGDILNAFGLYQDESEFSPFGYDPAEGVYMDFLTKDAAVDALEYLRELYQEGALKINFDGSPDTALSDFKNGICASYYGDYHEYDNCTNVLTLNTAYPKWICTNLSGYYLTYDTPQPQETVNMLVDMLYGSEDNYLDSRFGSGHYLKNSDDTLTIELTRNSTGRFVIPAMPNLVQTLPGLFSYSEANILYSKDGVTTTTAGLSAYQQLLDKAIADGIVSPIVPVATGNYYQSSSSVLNQGYHTDHTFYSIQKYIFKFYNACIKDAITGTGSIPAIVAEYRTNMEKLTGNRYTGSARHH